MSKKVKYIFPQLNDGRIIVRSTIKKYAPNGAYIGYEEGKSVKFENGQLETDDPEVIKYMDDPRRSRGQWHKLEELLPKKKSKDNE